MEAQKTKVTIDANRLIAFDEAKKDLSTAKSPALYRFDHDGRVLWYLASKHSVDSKSETFRLIEHVFKSQKIDVVVVEGFETRLGVNPKSISDYILAEQKKNPYSNGEPAFVIENSVKRGVPFIGGEPSEKDIFRTALDRGFTAQDMIGFEFVRRMPQLKRAGTVKDMGTLGREFSSYSLGRAMDLDLKDFKFSFADFSKWYRKNQSQELSVESGDKGETAPMNGHYFTQKISLVVTRLRDEHIINTIAELLNQHKSVFVVYGSSHYRIEHLALKAALGSPTQIELTTEH
jgi:hypothetical protein